MQVEIVVPGVGESVSEGMLTRWIKQTGQYVEKDEPVAELETDKATVEVVSNAAGILETLVAEGNVVKVHAPIARVDSSASRAAETTASKVVLPTPELSRNGPAVVRLLKETGSDVSHVEPSGRGGRLTKGDVLGAISQKEDSAVKATLGGGLSAAVEPILATPQTVPAGARGLRRKSMSMIRRRIAERLLAAQRNAAILTTFNEVDMTAVQKLREQYKGVFEEKFGVKLGFMGFFIRAVVEALKDFPEVNASIEGTDIVYHDFCDIGVAVSTEKGLMVPVLRNAESLSLADTEVALGAFARKARDGKISVDDLAYGTFSITNGGVFGSLLSTPIINPPQSAILGMHKIQMRPICTPDGKIEARPMMYLALSYDHRIIDGRDAVGFLVKVKQGVEDPGRLLVGV